MEELERRSRVAVRVVGVQAQRQRGVGEVGRSDGDAHVEEAPVVRLAHSAEEGGHLLDEPRLGGNAVEEGEAEHGDVAEPRRPRSRVVDNCRPVVLGQRRRERGVPPPDRRRLGPAEPLGREDAAVPVAPLDRQRAVVGHVRRGAAQPGQDARGLEQALAADGMPARLTRASVAERQHVPRDDAPVRELDPHHPVVERGGLHGTESMRVAERRGVLACGERAG